MTARPTLNSAPVAWAHAEHIAREVAKRHPAHPVDSDGDTFVEVVGMALLAHTDGFARTVQVHQNGYERFADAYLVSLFGDTVSAQRILTDHEREWVVKTGIRFKAKTGDVIEFTDRVGMKTRGVVTGVLSSRACGLVTVTVHEGSKTFDTHVIVPAENVIRVVETAVVKPVMPKTYA